MVQWNLQIAEIKELFSQVYNGNEILAKLFCQVGIELNLQQKEKPCYRGSNVIK